MSDNEGDSVNIEHNTDDEVFSSDDEETAKTVVEGDDQDDDDDDVETLVEEDEQDDEDIQQSHFVEEMMGGPKQDDDVFVELDNKKIMHQDEVLLLHPESQSHNYDEISKGSVVTRNKNNIIVDQLHTSMPILTKYEMAKILGQRTKQLNTGCEPFIRLDRHVIDNSLIAEEELKQKKLPFIIQRPLPNGGFEYWHVKDLEIISIS